MNAYLYVLSFSLVTSTLFGNPDFQNQDYPDQRGFDDQRQNEYFTRPYLDDPTSTHDDERENFYSRSIADDHSASMLSESPSAAVANDSTPYYSAEQNSSLSYCADSQNYSACEECNACCDTCNDWNIWIYPDYFYIAHTEGKGIGYRKGFTTLGVFLTPSFLGSSGYRTFLDAKGYIFNDGKWAASAGVGSRFILPSRDIVLGLNVYYDYRKFHQFDLNQIGVGFEVLGPCWDLRVNGYIPTGKTNFRESRLFEYSYGFFAVQQRRISAWYGVDGEFGAWIKRKYSCDWWGLYAAAGPYYYFREHKKHFGDSERHEVFGGRVRLLARIFDILDVSVSVTYDPKWHTCVQGLIAFVIPLDGRWCLNQKCTSKCSPCLLEQIAEQPVQRNGIIVADKGRCCWAWNWDASGCGCSSNGRPRSHSITSSELERIWDSSSSKDFNSSSKSFHFSSSEFEHGCSGKHRN